MSNQVRQRADVAGFTLFEVLISLAILASITTLVYSALSGTLRLTELAEEDEATVNGGRVAIARMQRELAMAFLDPRVYAGARSGSRAGGTLVQNYTTAFKGEDSSPIDKLSFSTFSHVRLYHGSTEGDQAEISYYGEPDEQSQGLSVLMHRETGRIDGEPEEGGVVEILARGVQELDIQYYDSGKEEWTQSWDHESPENRNRLPKAVALALKMVDSQGFVHTYRTRVAIQLWRPLPPRLMGRPPKKTASSGTKTQKRRRARVLRRRSLRSRLC